MTRKLSSLRRAAERLLKAHRRCRVTRESVQRRSENARGSGSLTAHAGICRAVEEGCALRDAGVRKGRGKVSCLAA